MPPIPRGIPTPRSKKVRRYTEITVATKRNPIHRTRDSLLSRLPTFPVLNKGRPLLRTDFEAFQQNAKDHLTLQEESLSKSIIKYQQLSVAKFYNVNASYCFVLGGYFYKCGSIFLKHFCQVAKELFVVGWIKCRPLLALGQLQGDAIALAYMQRILSLKGMDGARIHRVTFSDQTYGMKNIEYSKLVILQDFRNAKKKAQHEIEQKKVSKVDRNREWVR